MEQEIHQGAIEYLGGIQYLGKLFHQQGGAQWSINREHTTVINRGGGGQMTQRRKLIVWAIFFHSKHEIYNKGL